MKRFKTFAAGLLIGIIITGTITAFAEGQSFVQAFLGNYKITVDGKDLQLASDTAIINYNNRIYTPSRAVAEALGATVGWDELSQTVTIKSPEPKIVEREIEKIVEVPAERDFQYIPVRYQFDGCYIEVYGINNLTKATELNIAVENKSDISSTLFVNYADAYIMLSDGTKITQNDADNVKWRNGIDNDKRKEDGLTFDKIDKDEKKLTIYIPYSLENNKTGEVEKNSVTFYADFTKRD